MAGESDAEKLTRWIEEHGNAVRGFVWARTRQSGDAHLMDDLVQEVFFRAWRNRGPFIASGKDRAYLLTIADRLICDHQRKNRNKPRLAIDPDSLGKDAEHEAGLEHAEDSAALTKALDSLTDPQRRTILLRYYGQMSFQEIAEQLKCPLNTVLSHCRRGLEALRSILAEAK